MRDADQMTPEELEALAKEKRVKNIPVKEGFLKEDLYSANDFSTVDLTRYDLVTKIEVEEAINPILERLRTLEPAVKKGTRFICLMINGEETWWDEPGEWIEEASEFWANKHLENIRPIKKAKS